jgi:hypothetical protein
MSGAALRWAPRILAFALLAGAALWLAVGLADPELLVSLADRLAYDGEAEQVTVETVRVMQGRAWQAGASWLLLALALLGGFSLLGGVATPASPATRESAARRAAGGALRFLREEPGHALLLSAFILLCAGLAIASLGTPIRCDEATTHLKYVSRSWPTSLLLYSTNNHMLYSVLAKLACSADATAPSCLRMPALLAGILAVPASYLAARMHFGRHTALLVAGALCTSLLLLDHATNGRSYTLLTLVFVLLIALAPRLVTAGSPTPWIGFAVLASLGLWANPVMLYPLAILGFWVGLRALTALRGDALLAFTARGLLACLVVAALVAAWYAPAYVATGLDSAVTTVRDHPVIPPGPSETRSERLAEGIGRVQWVTRTIWRDWTHGRGAITSWLLLGGGATALLIRPSRRRAWEWGAASVLGIAAIQAITGATPPYWIFLFLLPLALTIGLAGIVAAFTTVLRGRFAAWRGHVAGIAAIALALQGAVAARSPLAGTEVPWFIGYPEAAAAASFLHDALQPGERFYAHAIVTPGILFHMAESGACPRSFPWACVLSDGERPQVLYFVDEGHRYVPLLLEALDARGYGEPKVVHELERSRILQLSPVPRAGTEP